jgi:hypothetical protein
VTKTGPPSKITILSPGSKSATNYVKITEDIINQKIIKIFVTTLNSFCIYYNKNFFNCQKFFDFSRKKCYTISRKSNARLVNKMEDNELIKLDYSLETPEERN